MPMIASIASAAIRALGAGLSGLVALAKDLYYNLTVLLLNGETPNPIFNGDASTNNFESLITSEPKPSPMTPYNGAGYYSNYFNGSTDYISIAPTLGLTTSTTPFTMEAWVYFTAFTSVAIASTAFASSGPIPFVMGMGPTGTGLGGTTAGAYPAFGYYNGSAWTTPVTTSTALLTNTWYHLAYVYTGTTATIYSNGVSIGSASATTWQTTGQANFYVGRRWDTAGGTYFSGYINNFRLVIGTAVYTTAFTPPTTGLSNITNTTLLTCQSNRFIDNSSNAYAITVTGAPQVTQAIPFTQPSITNGSAYFNASSYVSIPSTATNFSNLALGSGDFTVECWLYTNTVTSAQNILFDTRTTDPQTNPNVYMINATIYWRNNGTNTLSGTILISTWTHFAVVKKSGTITMYLNGVSASSVADSSTYGAAAFQIGKAWDSNYWNGYIADFRIVKGTGVYSANFTPTTTPLTSITGTQLLTLQYKGNATNYGIVDDSQFNNIITRNGNVSLTSFSPFSQTGFSYYCYGDGAYVNIGYSTQSDYLTSNDFTIEIWYCPVKFQANSSLLNVASTTAATSNFQIYVNGTGTVVAQIFSGSTAYTISSSSNLTLNNWFHIAYTRIGAILTLYINGQSVGTLSGAGVGINNNANGIGIGAIAGVTTAAGLIGYFTDARIINGQGIYTGNFTPPTKPLDMVYVSGKPGTTFLVGNPRYALYASDFYKNVSYSRTTQTTGNIQVAAFSPFGNLNYTPVSYSISWNSDPLQLPSSSLMNQTGDFTIECWLLNGYNAPGSDITIFGEETAGKLRLGINGTSLTVVNPGSGAVITSSIALPQYYAPSFTSGNWTHVALVRSGSGTNNVTLYVGGQVAGQTTFTTNTNSSAVTYIGGRTLVANSYFAGYMSNLRVCYGTAVYTSTFIPPTSPLTAIPGTTFLLNSRIMQDSSPNGITISWTQGTLGTAKMHPISPFGWTTSSNAYSPAVNGGSAYFDGTGDYLTAPASSTWTFGSSDFTVEAWIYPTTLTAGAIIVGAWSNTAATSNWVMTIGSTATTALRFGISTGSAFTYYESGAAFLGLNQWFHVTVIRASSGAIFYVNGAYVYAATVSQNLSISTSLSVGAASNGTNPFTGFITGVRVTPGKAIYATSAAGAAYFYPSPTPPTSFSATNLPASLLLNFANGGIVDAHSSVGFETVGNAQASTSVTKYGSSSLRFNGSQYLVPSGFASATVSGPLQNFLINSQDFTIELWVYIVTYSATVAQLYDTRPAGTGSTTTYQLINVSSTGVVAYSTTGSISGGSVPLTTWTHIAVSRSGTSTKLFVNGTQVGSTYTDSVVYALGNNRPIIGTDGNVPLSAGYSLIGYIDDLRVTKMARYTANFILPTVAPTQ